jgi:hypothetical protein
LTDLIAESGDSRAVDLLELLGALSDVATSNLPERSKVLIWRTIVPVIRGENPLYVAVLGERKGKAATAARACAMAYTYEFRKAEFGAAGALLQTALDFGTSESSVKAAYAIYGALARNLATLGPNEITKLVEMTQVVWPRSEGQKST